MTSTGQFDRKKNTSIGIDEMTNDLDTEISWLIVHYLPERCIYIYNKLVGCVEAFADKSTTSKLAVSSIGSDAVKGIVVIDGFTVVKAHIQTMLLPNRGPVQFTMNQDFPVDLRHLHTCIVYLNMALNDLCIFCTPNNQDTQGKENGCNITSLPLALSFLRSVMGWIKKALDILDDSNYKITPIVVKSVAEANHDLVVSVGIHRGKFATIIEVSNLPTFRPMTPPNIIDGSTNKTHDRSYAGGNLASTKEFRIFSDFPKVASTQEVLQKCLVELTSILDQIESMVLLYA